MGCAALSGFSFQNLAPGGYLTFVSASSLEAAWNILSQNAYKDCDVHSRYALIHECSETPPAESREALEERGPRNEDPVTVKA